MSGRSPSGNVSRVVAALLRKAVAPVAPPACFGCGASAGSAAPLCSSCRGGLGWLSGEVVSLEGPGATAIEAWAPLAYRGGARALARAVKFGGAVGLTQTMAAQIVATAPAGALDRGELVPVPLHPARRRRRGFNQAELLARALSRRTGLAVADCLERTGARGTQMGRDRDDRLAALAGAVRVRRGGLAPREAILVDDVLTTGATMLACSRSLHATGCEHVAGVAYARTPGR
ncbi:MAG: ComF family protein [Actinomycetota bacterium]|nr:ComF family protein [Actinomycetota bacterium]